MWVRMRDSGKSMPVDAFPSPSGNIEVDRGLARVVPAAEVPSHAGPLYRSHFASCANAKAHRKSG